MSEVMWVRSHVERLLQEEWASCRVYADEDGDYPFRDGTSACWVSVVDTCDGPFVRVFAHAAVGTKASLKLFRELNELQAQCRTATVYWDNGLVIVKQTVSPVGLTRTVLHQAIDAVTGVAHGIGVLAAAMYDGCTPFEPEQPEPTNNEAA